jgi:hypothetical protein
MKLVEMNSGKLLVMVLTAILIGCGGKHSGDEHADHNASTSEQASVKSPRKAAMVNVGDNHVHIDYSAPSVRGRTVWGGLVAYDNVWVTGAHSATNINFGNDLKVNNTVIPAGKYALFTIPREGAWTVIINKNWDQHLADDYDQTEDVLRFDVEPEILNENVEQLNYSVESTGGNNGKISISWEKIRISFDIETME